MSVTDFPDDYSKNVPPDTISNSVVKLLSADDSVGPPHVKVGHRQGFKSPLASSRCKGFYCLNQLSNWNTAYTLFCIQLKKAKF